MSDKNINYIINNSIKFIEYRIEPCHITIKKDLNETIPYVYIDADNISQVLINIMVNALESMPDGGTLTIKTDTCKEHDNCVTVCIADTGCGIREELKDKIFEPFFTTKNKEGEKGLGMGLAISKRIIEDHHGKINVESNIGKGTTFRICLPASKKKIN